MRWMDKIACTCLLAAGLIWWLGVWVPERDAHLFAVHECFVEAGCQERSWDIDDVNECWSSCDRVVLSAR